MKTTTQSQMVTIEEKIALYLSRQLKNGELGFVGTGSVLGMAACLLAQDLTAPDLSWIAGESGFVNPSPPLVRSVSGFQPRTEATKSVNAITRYLGKGVDFFIIEVFEIDEKARINRQMASDYAYAQGSGSTPYLRLAKKALLFTREHSPSILIKKTQFVSTSRIHDKGKTTLLVTPLAVFEWTDKSEKPVLISFFSQGPNEETIRKKTGFDYLRANEISVVPEPSSEETDSLRTVVDPRGFLRDLYRSV